MKKSINVVLIIALLLMLFVVAGSASGRGSDFARVLVEFRPGAKAAVKGALVRTGGNIHFEFDEFNTMAVTLPQAALKGIENNPNVVLVEEDAPRYLMGDGGQFVPWGVERVQAPQMWDEGYTGDGLMICIVDSGLHVGHVDMQGVDVVGGFTNIEDSTWDVDFCGHGTHVAGTIAAVNNEIGVVGVAPDVSLYIVKVFGDDCGWAYTSNLGNAVQNCAAAGANIISMSLGGSGKSHFEERVFQSFYDQGILSVAAAGNDANTRYSYPASHPSVISVAATDINNEIADFSQQNDQVELAAPGVAVDSTVPWLAIATLTVDEVTYEGHQMEFAPDGTPSGELVFGGLCDSSGDWGGKVVLCERGEYDFVEKVTNVKAGGGVAAVIYNNEPGNFYGTLGSEGDYIPAISLSQEDGQYLVEEKLGYVGDVFSQLFIPDSSYEAWDGTSMATPHVSAVAALLWSTRPNRLTNADIREAMVLSALDLGESGRDNAYGFGLVQAHDALTYLKPGQGPKQ